MSDFHIGPSKSVGPSQAQQQKLQAKKLQQYTARQIYKKEEFSEWAQEGFNPILIRRKFESLKKHSSRAIKIGEEQVEDDIERIEAVEKAEETASRFQRENPELQAKTLLILRGRITIEDSVDTILEKVLEFYKDPFLADEALRFLLQTTEGELHEKVLQAQKQFHANFEREIKAGRNIALQSREFSKEGLGTPGSLRDMYRDITVNRRDAHTLFDELSSQFKYEKMKTVIDFFLHSLGADLKSKGPSISRGQLSRLIEDTRTLQAILGVYDFFKGRMQLIHSLFEKSGLYPPIFVTFENLSKEFMQLLKERYISPERILHISSILGISEELAAKIIIYSQFRDAIRQIAPKLYRNSKHQKEVYETIIELLEELEEEEEEEEEE